MLEKEANLLEHGEANILITFCCFNCGGDDFKVNIHVVGEVTSAGRGHIDKFDLPTCPDCGSKSVSPYVTTGSVVIDALGQPITEQHKIQAVIYALNPEPDPDLVCSSSPYYRPWAK